MNRIALLRKDIGVMQTFLIIENLVDDDIVCIYFELSELLYQSLSFIKREELRNANTDKGCHVLPPGK